MVMGSLGPSFTLQRYFQTLSVSNQSQHFAKFRTRVTDSTENYYINQDS